MTLADGVSEDTAEHTGLVSGILCVNGDFYPYNYYDPKRRFYLPGETCSDGVRNGDEEDIDCGGTQCTAVQNFFFFFREPSAVLYRGKKPSMQIPTNICGMRRTVLKASNP